MMKVQWNEDGMGHLLAHKLAESTRRIICKVVIPVMEITYFHYNIIL